MQNEEFLRKSVFLNLQTVGKQHSVFGDEQKDYGVSDDATFLEVCTRAAPGSNLQRSDLRSVQCAFCDEDNLFLIRTDFSTNSHGWAKSAKFATYLMHYRVTPSELLDLETAPPVAAPWKTSALDKIRARNS